MSERVSLCLGYQQITTLSASAGLTLPSHVSGQKPRLAIIQAEAVAVRWRDDGTAPTSTVGMRLIAGDSLEYDGDLNKIRFIEESASAKLNVSYYQ